jgi:hypothetical protein
MTIPKDLAHGRYVEWLYELSDLKVRYSKASPQQQFGDTLSRTAVQKSLSKIKRNTFELDVLEKECEECGSNEIGDRWYRGQSDLAAVRCDECEPVEPCIPVAEDFWPEQLRTRKTKKTCIEEDCNGVKETGRTRCRTHQLAHLREMYAQRMAPLKAAKKMIFDNDKAELKEMRKLGYVPPPVEDGRRSTQGSTCAADNCSENRQRGRTLCPQHHRERQYALEKLHRPSGTARRETDACRNSAPHAHTKIVRTTER